MKIKSIIGASTLLALSAPLQATLINFDLENIGADGSVTNSITSGGVTINIAPVSGSMYACTYGDNSPWCFSGAEGVTNTALNPTNVSGTRFISTYASPQGTTNINNAVPITFTFSEAIMSFGLTTLDLLEDGGNDGITFTLSGNGGSSTHSMTGPQGASGLDLDFAISSSLFDITSVTFDMSGGSAWNSAYGIDDLFIEVKDASVPEPSIIALLSLGLFGISVAGRKKA